MDAHDIYANSAHGVCANSKWLLTTSMQITLTQKGQAALWVNNGLYFHVKTNYYIGYAHGRRQ